MTATATWVVAEKKRRRGSVNQLFNSSRQKPEISDTISGKTMGIVDQQPIRIMQVALQPPYSSEVPNKGPRTKSAVSRSPRLLG